MSARKTLRWLNIMSVLGASQSELATEEIHRRLLGLADAGAVHLRTVQRDLIELLDSGLLGLLHLERDGRGWWRIDRSFRAFRNYDHLSLSAALTLARRYRRVRGERAGE